MEKIQQLINNNTRTNSVFHDVNLHLSRPVYICIFKRIYIELIMLIVTFRFWTMWMHYVKMIRGWKVPEWSQGRGTPPTSPSLAGFRGAVLISMPGGKGCLQRRLGESDQWRFQGCLSPTGQRSKAHRKTSLSALTLYLRCPVLKSICWIVFRLNTLNQFQKSNLKFPFIFEENMESRLKQLPKAIFSTVCNKSPALCPISKWRSWQNSTVFSWEQRFLLTYILIVSKSLWLFCCCQCS